MKDINGKLCTRAEWDALEKDPEQLYIVEDQAGVTLYLGSRPVSSERLTSECEGGMLQAVTQDRSTAQLSAASANASATTASNAIAASLGHRQQASSERALAESARDAAQQARDAAGEHEEGCRELKSQSQEIYDGLISVNTFMVGHAYNYGIIIEGNQARICWSDPEDVKTSDFATIARWRKTRLIYKTGGFPEHELDGTILIDNMIRNKHKEVPFTFDMGSGSDYYFGLFTQTAGGVWNTTHLAPRFTTGELTWSQIAMMTRTNNLMSFPGMEIGVVVDIQVNDMYPALRYKLAHVNYTGGFATVGEYVGDVSRQFNSIWIPHLLPCLGSSSVAQALAFDGQEAPYGRTWDSYFKSNRSYYRLDGSSYVLLTAETDYQTGTSVPDWEEETGLVAYVKNHLTGGCAIWEQSNIRQWLNAGGAEWYSPQNEWDVLGNFPNFGWLDGFAAGFLDLLHKVNVSTVNTAKSSTVVNSTYDLFWLPSRTNILNTAYNNILEGRQLAYFRDVAVTPELRRQRDVGGTARTIWLRTLGESNAKPSVLNADGASVSLLHSATYTDNRFLPCFCIA